MRKIIIAPYQMHKNLLSYYRSEDAFSNIKIITKEDLIGQHLGRVNSKAIPYLIKKYSYSFDNCLSLLSFIPYFNNSIPNLLKIKEDLIKQHLLVKNDYLDVFFKGNEVLIYGYSKNDKELINALECYTKNYDFIINEEKSFKEKLLEFETQFDEVFYVLNRIAQLIADGTDINKIYIYSSNNEYDYYLKTFSKDFGFKIDIDSAFSLYSTPLFNEFIKQYKENKDYLAAKESLAVHLEEELYDEIVGLIDECYDAEMSFEQQMDYLVGRMKNAHSLKTIYKDVVKVINKPIFENDAYIFVLGFAQGIYPSSHKDNLFISDVNKEKLGINTSLDLNKIDRDTVIDFFNSDNHFVFSFANRSLSNKYFISPLANYFNLDKEKVLFPEHIYSKDMVNFYFAKAKDMKEFYSEVLPYYSGLERISDITYGSYDNSFSGVDVFNHSQRMNYSYSSINDYYKCPFMYYLSNVLGLDPFEGNLYTKFGKVAHKIFELHNEKDFDFEKTFDEEVAKQEFLPEELPIVENLKKQVKSASEAIRLHQRYMTNPKFVTEYKVEFPFTNNSYLKGFIDKAIILDDKYLAIVDYKTGNDSFSPEYINEGVSLQLPTYCLLSIKDEMLKKYKIVGVFINNVIDNRLSYSIPDDSLINPYYRLNGKVIADVSLISFLDKTIGDNKSEFIKSVKVTKEKVLGKSASLASEEEFDEYAEVAMRKFLEADTCIRDNKFPINPLYINSNNNACTHCSFKNICFVRANQRRIIVNENELESEEDADE